MEIPSALWDLARVAWLEYTSRCEAPYVVNPSIPILYFGDLPRYLDSGLKVITAALNPSKREFPVDDRCRRFRQAEGIDPRALDVRYFDALNSYFKNEPYDKWFNSFEPVLNGMGASFYRGYRRTALHTDICSPLATDPTWGKLDEAIRAPLLEPGRQIWHDLIEYLQPDVILLSVAKRHLDAIRFPILGAPRELFAIQTAKPAKPYVVISQRRRLASGKGFQLIFGYPRHTPFGLIANIAKREIGGKVLAEVCDGPP